MYFVSIWQHCEGAVYSYRYLLLTFARGNVHAALITAPVVQAHKSTCGTSTPFLCEGNRQRRPSPASFVRMTLPGI